MRTKVNKYMSVIDSNKYKSDLIFNLNLLLQKAILQYPLKFIFVFVACGSKLPLSTRSGGIPHPNTVLSKTAHICWESMWYVSQQTVFNVWGLVNESHTLLLSSYTHSYLNDQAAQRLVSVLHFQTSAPLGPYVSQTLWKYTAGLCSQYMNMAAVLKLPDFSQTIQQVKPLRFS